MEEAKIPVLEFDDAIDELFVRHDGGQDTRKGVTRLAEYTDLPEIPNQADAALLVALDIFRGVYLSPDTFCFGPERLLAKSAFDRMLKRACGVRAKDLKGGERVEEPLTLGQAVTQVKALMGGAAFDYPGAADAPLNRAMAVSLVAMALRASDGSGDLPYLYFVAEDQSLQSLKLPKNSVVCGPDGKLVTLTVNGQFQPLVGGYAYSGDLRLTLTERYELYRYTTEPGGPGAPPDAPKKPPEPAYWNYFEEPYRAALFIEDGKKVPEKSIDAAYQVQPDGSIYITSSDAPSNAFGVNHFNGIIVGGHDADYRIDNLKVRFTGNGMDDFQGMGAGILCCGEDTRTVITNADIYNYGTVRSTLVAGGSAKVLVKNSRLATHEGIFEPGWVGGMGAEKMRTAPNIGGFEGNCRATNLLDKAEINYCSSVITAEKWGVLSTDNNKGVLSTVINSLVAITGGLNPAIDRTSEATARQTLLELPFDQVYGPWGRELEGDEPQQTTHCGGYGTYSIGNTTVKFAGSTVIAADYGNTCVNEDASVVYCSSAPENLEGVFGLEELGEVPVQNTVVFAHKDGMMLQRGSGNGHVTIRDNTLFHCGVHCFAVKSNGSFNINVDSSTLIAESGIILQLMDDDDKWAPEPDPDLPTAQQYAEAQALKDKGLLDVYHGRKGKDVFVKFSNMTVNGDCHNSCAYAGAITQKDLEDAGKPGPGGPFGPANPTDCARNLVLTLQNVTYNGAITAAFGLHVDRDTGRQFSPMPTDKWYNISTLDSHPAPVYQAGVLVTLKAGAVWNLDKACYLSVLTVEEGGTLNGRVFVNGKPVQPQPGVTYSGNILVQPA